MYLFLVALGGFHPLLSTQMTADLTLECSDGSMFHPWSHTAWKNPFYCAETVPSSVLNCRRVAVFDRLWANAVTISNRAFSCSNVQAKWLIDCLLLSSRCQLSHATLIYNRPKPFYGVFLYFLKQQSDLGDQSVQHHRCLYGQVWNQQTTSLPFVSMEQSPNNTCQTIALLERYFFPLKRNALSTHEIQIFPLFWKLQK